MQQALKVYQNKQRKKCPVKMACFLGSISIDQEHYQEYINF